MLFLSEESTDRLVTRELALEAVREALIAAAEGGATTFPILQGHGKDPNHRFAIKSARVDRHQLTGFKLGTYWPSSDAAGLPRGNSTVFFIDEQTGRLHSVVVNGLANAFRTAAADALAVALLARPNATRLALFGAGFQAFHEAVAISQVRTLSRIAVVNRDQARAEQLAQRLAQVGLMASPTSAQHACETSDIIVTVTASREALLDADWVKPGTHVSTMGSDAKGKRELPLSLLDRASLYADLVSQSTDIGEFQHAAAKIANGSLRVVPLGDVARGAHPGRRSPAEITVFDSSGIALQDLFLSKMLIEEAFRLGLLS